PIRSEADSLAVVTLQGRLLIFPVAELPALAKGKGNKLIQIPATDLSAGKDYVVAAVALPENGQLKVIAGKRQLTLKGADIENYSGSRAKRGLALPRGFQRVDGLESE
ncbi:MAG: DNA topoisomerase IV subunit A, partial [Methylobacter sp.]